MKMLQKVLHLAVVSLFALVGAENLVHGFAYIRYPWTAPRVTINYYPGETSILTGILFLLVAQGIFRSQTWARVTAIVIAGLCAAVMAVVLVKEPSVPAVLMIFVFSLILVWLLLPTVRMKFHIGKTVHKVV